MHHKYLIHEQPLLVLPSLATEIGLNEAIFLQQLHYWLRKSTHQHDGFFWIYNTYESWFEQFPFWSISTIKRIVKSLEESGIIITTSEFNNGFNNTKWYRIDYEKLHELTGYDNHTALIIDESPLIFQPALAVKHSVNEALFLQQLHYWITYSQLNRDDVYWVANSYQRWLSQFKFWNAKTLQRIIASLIRKRIISCTDNNSDPMNHTRWITIIYENINSTGQSERNIQSDTTSGQIDTTHFPEMQENSCGQNDTSLGHSDTTTGQNGTTHMDNLARLRDNLTLPLYKDSEIITERQTERTTDSATTDSICQLQIVKTDISKIYDTAFRYYTDLIDKSAVYRFNHAIEQLIKTAICNFGDNVVEQLFDAVKQSDYLLAETKFKPTFRWLFVNIDKILSGKYDTDGLSRYERAQECSARDEICAVLKHGSRSLPECHYCETYANHQPSGNTDAEIVINNEKEINIDELKLIATQCTNRHIQQKISCYTIQHHQRYPNAGAYTVQNHCQYCDLFHEKISSFIGEIL